MSASVAVAADANSQLSPEAGNTNIKSAETTGFLMRAGRWNPKQQKVIIENVPIPQPGPNQFLVKLASASLCHSDIMAIDAGQTATLGHEGAGFIESIHPSAEGKGFEVGDKIGFLYIIGCCFEYAVVDYPNCIKLPESIDVKTAAPIFCAGITAFHAVDSSELAAGDWLAIVGAGGLGQIATQIAKARGVKVVAIDINDDTLEVCKQQGADQVYNSKTNKNYIDELKQLTTGGCKAACVFSNAQAAYAGVPPILRLGGVMMIVGLPHDNVPISTMDLALGRYKVKSESTSIPKRMKKAVDFLGEHRIQPEVQLRKLEDLNDMVNEMRAGTATKRMLVAF
ncbi:hypothetical protein PRZ48_013289 [Zasmidium cellare]|uniref:Enoyl reductase (ER) domain-containing protein n=1 Tax=Zasmidium cellare TaxID=395010 RepID=A0ABR0E3P7_ZASCE|nr:hypothetical protein PRZ48_013289 [Zasmidium cellare]